jgi:hypothetical protein
MGVGLQCGSAADCPTSQVCCLWPKSGASACGDFRTATSNCYGGGVQLCDPNGSQNECVGNDGVRTCKPGGTGGELPMNYGTCQ